MVLTNEMINTINAGIHTAEAALDAALAAHQAIPARVPLAEAQPRPAGARHRDQLIHHAIRIAAFNTAQSLARAIVDQHRLHPRRRRSPLPDPHRSRRLRRHHPRPPHPAHPARPAPAPRHTAAIDELCQALNDTNTVYPGTGLTLRYSIKSHR